MLTDSKGLNLNPTKTLIKIFIIADYLSLTLFL